MVERVSPSLSQERPGLAFCFIESVRSFGIAAVRAVLLVLFLEYYRDHRKITVIDGKVGFTGGYNLANEYFNYTHPYGQWKDTGIRLEGDAVQSLTVTFLEMWNAVSEKATNDTDFSKYIIHYDYKAQQTGFVQPYALSGILL